MSESRKGIEEYKELCKVADKIAVQVHKSITKHSKIISKKYRLNTTRVVGVMLHERVEALLYKQLRKRAGIR